MKTNLIKRLFAGAVVAATLVSSAIMANAYKDTSFPYSNDFEHWKVESWDFWLQPTYNTGLGATAYGSEATLAQIVVDEDPAHNLVYYMSRPSTDTAERFIYWLLPAVTEGKYVLEFDAKVTGNGMWFTGRQENHTGSGEPQIMIMKDNAITSGGAVVSTYETGEWKSFKMLFDVETGDVTTFVDGKSATVNNSLFKTARAMYFSVNADATMSLDNIKTYLVDDSVNPNLVLDENGEAVGSFADEEADSFVLSLDNGEFGTLPEVSVTCLGEDIMSDSDDYDFAVSTQLSDGKVIITPEDYFEVGSRYAVTVADGTTDLFGRAVNTTPIVFDVAENNGWVTTKSYEEDFNVESVSTSAKPGTSGAVNWVITGTIELVTGSSYSDGKAIKLGGSSQFELNGFGGFMKKGRVHIETNVDMGMGTYFKYDTGDYATNTLFFGQKAVDLTGDGEYDESINFQYQAGAAYPNTLWDSRKLKENELEVIDYTLDIDNLKSYITYNGESFTITAPQVTSTSADLINKGFQNIRIFQNGATDPMIIDYIKWSHEYLPAVVKSIEATNVTDGKVAANSQLVITFSEGMTEDTLSNITVSDGTENAAYTGAWNEEALTYTLTFDSRLKGETEYTVTVPETVTDLNSFPVDTAYGTFTTDVVPPMDVENLAAVKADADVTVTADVTNAVEGKVYLLVAGYKGNQMKAMDFVAVDVTEDTTEISYTFTLQDTDVDTVKAFAVSDMLTIKPYCAAVQAN